MREHLRSRSLAYVVGLAQINLSENPPPHTQKEEFKVWFLPKVYCFFTIAKLTKCTSNHHKLGTVCHVHSTCFSKHCIKSVTLVFLQLFWPFFLGLLCKVLFFWSPLKHKRSLRLHSGPPFIYLTPYSLPV